MSSALRHRLVRNMPLLLAAVVPAVLVGIGVAKYILNHFFANAPVLLDAGWYSDIVYQAGLWPRNPRIACDYAEYYYGVHPSPYISLWSALSYLAPFKRIEWYAIFQAFTFIPFGFAVYAVSSRVEPEALLRRLPLLLLAAFAFTFHGQIILMVAYPHYEGAMPAFACLWLAALLTGRRRLAWLFLGLAISVREDAGVHAALALTPVLYLHMRGVAMPVTRRTLLYMFGTAIIASAALIFCQKFIANGPSIIKVVYLGDPVLHHVNAGMLQERFVRFLERCPTLYYPFVATCVVALLRRDGRYLLGWAAGIPWFLLNFVAAQEQKATFEAYAHFPYIISLFWVFAYGALLAPRGRQLRPGALELVFALICLSSTLGLFRAYPHGSRVLVNDMIKLRPINRAQVHGFVDALATGREELGELRVDYAVAAIALESLTEQNGWRPGTTERIDTLAFHSGGAFRDQILPDLFRNELDVCTRIRGTHILVCTREHPPASAFAGLKTDSIPSTFAVANSLRRRGVRVEPHGIAYHDGVGIDAYLGQLPAGSYAFAWKFESDASADGTDLFQVDVLAGETVRASQIMKSDSRELILEFEANGGEVLWFRSWALQPSRILVRSAKVRKLR